MNRLTEDEQIKYVNFALVVSDFLMENELSLYIDEDEITESFVESDVSLLFNESYSKQLVELEEFLEFAGFGSILGNLGIKASNVASSASTYVNTKGKELATKTVAATKTFASNQMDKGKELATKGAKAAPGIAASLAGKGANLIVSSFKVMLAKAVIAAANAMNEAFAKRIETRILANGGSFDKKTLLKVFSSVDSIITLLSNATANPAAWTNETVIQLNDKIEGILAGVERLKYFVTSTPNIAFPPDQVIQYTQYLQKTYPKMMVIQKVIDVNPVFSPVNKKIARVLNDLQSINTSVSKIYIYHNDKEVDVSGYKSKSAKKGSN